MDTVLCVNSDLQNGVMASSEIGRYIKNFVCKYYPTVDNE